MLLTTKSLNLKTSDRVWFHADKFRSFNLVVFSDKGNVGIDYEKDFAVKHNDDDDSENIVLDLKKPFEIQVTLNQLWFEEKDDRQILKVRYDETKQLTVPLRNDVEIEGEILVFRRKK